MFATAAMFAAVALQLGTAQPGPIPPGADPREVATAVRAPQPPVIDGKDLDAVWRNARLITDFREFQPVEDTAPRFRTEARVAYDTRNLYVFIRAYDPHPDSILTLLARRDIRTPSDQLKIIIDSYHDRRTGYEFAVNPAGVKRDYAVYDDGNEDGAWDGVWDASATVDSLGWTAEFRIPLSQLRYVPQASNTFGFGIWRDIQRYTERVSWPVYRVSRSGFISQLGELTGLRGLPAPRRLEVSPYVVTENAAAPSAPGLGRSQDFKAGADIKYGLTSNLTLDATVNPDFGQVEADPAVLNLSAFETFFSERRPFFLEGTGIFRFPIDCSAVNCSGEALFYSRRIGRAPQLAATYGDATSPTQSTILGAGKLTGRLPSGLTVGVLEAVTGRETGIQDRTIEPLTNFAVLRAQQDLRRGESGVGVMVTAVNRNLDRWTDPLLRRDAYVGAIDFRHRFLSGNYEISGSFDVSRVSGSPEAIAATQTNSTHYYQRPDDGVGFDPERTSLTGDAEELYFGKVGGDRIHFETSYQRHSPGFEVNDMGFLRRADDQNWNTWVGLRWNRPAAFYQRAFWNFNWWQYWTAAGLSRERATNTNAHVQLNNRWWVHAGGTVGQLGSTYCDRCARGGPAVRQDPYIAPWGGLEGDDRHPIVPFFWVNYFLGEGGRSQWVDINPSVDFRLSTRIRSSLGLDLYWNHDNTQWFGNLADSTDALHYTFAHLEQRTAAVTMRVDYTFTRDLTLQVYAQPYVSKGTYSDVRELADPRAADYDARFQPYGDPAVVANPGGFNFKQFRSNVVLRWEYRPGSRIFVVWTQGRQDFVSRRGDRSLPGDFHDLFDLRPENTFLVKASYWINW